MKIMRFLFAVLFLLFNFITPTNTYAQSGGYCATQRLVNQWSCVLSTRNLCDTQFWDECWEKPGACKRQGIGDCLVPIETCKVVNQAVSCVSSPSCRTALPVNECSEGTTRKGSCNLYTSNYLGCWVSESTPPPAPTPTCTITLLPETSTIGVDSTTTLLATVTPSNGTVTSVDFSSDLPSVVSVSPASDTTVSYTTDATALIPNQSATITANVIMSGSSRCSATAGVTVSPTSPWWQVKDGDVVTTNNLVSSVPNAKLFITNGLGGYPGVAVYGGTFNLSPTYLTRISTIAWSANTQTSISRLFNYSYFRNLTPSDIVFSGASIGTVVSPQYGYEWFKTTGNLTIGTDVNLGNRKVILFVENGNLNIDAKINLNDNVGFFGSFVDGNINVNSLITGSPAIEGIYMSDGVFNTGTGNTQLHVRGSVASFGGFNLQRDLDDDTSPAELFEFAPDQVLLYPTKLMFTKTKWAEVAP